MSEQPPPSAFEYQDEQEEDAYDEQDEQEGYYDEQQEACGCYDEVQDNNHYDNNYYAGYYGYGYMEYRHVFVDNSNVSVGAQKRPDGSMDIVGTRINWMQ